jgi:hypothetical protein
VATLQADGWKKQDEDQKKIALVKQGLVVLIATDTGVVVVSTTQKK